MERYFNTSGPCNAKLHYMVNLQGRLKEIKRMIDKGEYFVIRKARQYGKTTMLKALKEYLHTDYHVLSLDFQSLSHTDFESEASFFRAFAREVFFAAEMENFISEKIKEDLKNLTRKKDSEAKLAFLFQWIRALCKESKKPVVLMIDEVDSASNYQVFLDFLAQMRLLYIHKDDYKVFQSVILAGVYDIKNLKQKIREDKEYRRNSPWNIAAPFKISMSFSLEEIACMLKEYEMEHNTNMDIMKMAQLLYDYTSGYPYLVSRICQIIAEDNHAVWTKESFLKSVKTLLSESNTLFDSFISKLYDYPKLKKMLYFLIFCGKSISYSPDEEAIDIAVMFGFVKEKNGNAVIHNRIFETRLYNLFLTSSEAQDTDIYDAALLDKNQFVKNGSLDMEHILERFVVHFHDLYGECSKQFIEEDGRKYFLLYLRPIINGRGHYYIEAETRNKERTDVIVDYNGEQFIIELKIWHGNVYKEQGEEQLCNYLKHYHLKKGYLLSFNFNKKKEIGIQHKKIGEYLLIEAVA